MAAAKDLSILIPARNEEFLARTIEDIVENIEADTEVIVVLDGEWANPPIPQHPRVNVIFLAESIGQRAATNLACRLSEAKYIMKVDAHCSFDKGFDRKLIEDMQDDWTVVPTMRNLHAFNWECECGFTHYQDKGSKCPECRKEMVKKMVWEPRKGTRNYSYCFDSEPHFQYFGEFSRRPEGQGELTESMSIQGSCFMLTREKYWELNISDEAFGSWGSQGIEVACKTWLSGGKVMINHKTWYAHMFRTKQANGFGFPYPQSGKQVDNAKKVARELFFEGKWGKAIRPVSWLVERFAPVPGWSQEDLDNLKNTEKVV
jgi:glycosyltransferase involved in cell wall biosynthesis